MVSKSRNCENHLFQGTSYNSVFLFVELVADYFFFMKKGHAPKCTARQNEETTEVKWQIYNSFSLFWFSLIPQFILSEAFTLL